MVRVPGWWAGKVTAPAQGLFVPGSSVAARRIDVTPLAAYRNRVDVDLGNDGIAPQALFSGAGAATAQIGPSGWGVSWALDQASVSTSVGPLDSAQCALYVGPLAIPATQVVSSLAGGGSQFGLGGLGLDDGWFVWAQWTGGTSGAIAYLRVTGIKTALTA